MLSTEHNKACVDQYEATGVLESGRTDGPTTRPFVSSAPPAPERVRGRCPECGDHLVSNCYYVGGRGYIIQWECWSSLSDRPTCSYRKVI